jgi:hypothetical protein
LRAKGGKGIPQAGKERRAIYQPGQVLQEEFKKKRKNIAA